MDVKFTRQNVVDSILKGEVTIKVNVNDAIEVKVKLTREDLVKTLTDGSVDLVGISSIITDGNKEDY